MCIPKVLHSFCCYCEWLIFFQFYFLICCCWNIGKETLNFMCCSCNQQPCWILFITSDSFVDVYAFSMPKSSFSFHFTHFSFFFLLSSFLLNALASISRIMLHCGNNNCRSCLVLAFNGNIPEVCDVTALGFNQTKEVPFHF